MPKDKFGHEIKIDDIVLSDNSVLMVKHIESDDYIKTISATGSESNILGKYLIIYDKPSEELDKIKKQLKFAKEIYSTKLKMSDLIPGTIYGNKTGNYVYLGMGKLTSYACKCDFRTKRNCTKNQLECVDDKMVVNEKKGYLFTTVCNIQSKIFFNNYLECKKTKTLYTKSSYIPTYISILSSTLKDINDDSSRWVKYKIDINKKIFK